MFILLSLLYVKVFYCRVIFENMLISSVFVASVFGILCSSFEHKRSLWRRNLWEGIWSCYSWRTNPSLNKSLLVATDFGILCSSFDHERSLWRMNIWEGMWSCLSWRTYPPLNKPVLVATDFGILCSSFEHNRSLLWMNLWEAMWSCHSCPTYPSSNESVLVSTDFVILCSSLEHNCSLWRRNIWEGMWSCHSWRTYPSFNKSVLVSTDFGILCSSFEHNWSLWRRNLSEELGSCGSWRTYAFFDVSLSIGTDFGILCSSFEHKRYLWRRNLWEGMWSCHSWRTYPSFNESLLVGTNFGILCLSFKHKRSLSRRNLWEGIWSCHSWRTYPSFNESVLLGTDFPILCLSFEHKRYLSRMNIWEGICFCHSLWTYPSLNESVFVGTDFGILCSSFEYKCSVWRSNLWEGIWSCHSWRTYPSFNASVFVGTDFAILCSSFENECSVWGRNLWERMCVRHSWRTYASLDEIIWEVVATVFAILCSSLKVNWSLWRRSLWEGMWSWQSWRSYPSMNETISCVVVATVSTILCLSLKVKRFLWRSNLWEGIWSCHSWRIDPSFTESMVAALLFTVRSLSLEDKLSLWRSNLWERMWSCHTWRTFPSFNETISIVIRTFQKYSGLTSLSFFCVSILGVATMLSIVFVITCLLHCRINSRAVYWCRQRLGSHMSSKRWVFWRYARCIRESYIAHALYCMTKVFTSRRKNTLESASRRVLGGNPCSLDLGRDSFKFICVLPAILYTGLLKREVPVHKWKFWEGMWSSQVILRKTWRTLTSFIETQCIFILHSSDRLLNICFYDVLASTLYTGLLKRKVTVWKCKFWEGISSCQVILGKTWPTLPSFIETLCISILQNCRRLLYLWFFALLPSTLYTRLLKKKVPVCNCKFWEGMWSCQMILRIGWRTLLSFTETLRIMIRRGPMIRSSGPEFSSDNAGDGPTDYNLDKMTDVLHTIQELKEDTNNSSNGLDAKTFQLTVLDIISSVVLEMRDTKSQSLTRNQTLDSCLKELREEAEKSTSGVEAKTFQLQVLTIISLLVKEMRESRVEIVDNKPPAYPCLLGDEARLDENYGASIGNSQDTLIPAAPLSQETAVSTILEYDVDSKQQHPAVAKTEHIVDSNNGIQGTSIDIPLAIETVETNVSTVLSKDVKSKEQQSVPKVSDAIQILQSDSTEIKTEEPQNLNTALLNFQASQPDSDPSKKPSWVVSESGNEKCIYCKCLVDTRYHVHEMGKVHRKRMKHSGTVYEASLLYLASRIRDTVRDNVAVYFVSMQNQQILVNNDLTTILDSLAFSVAYKVKDGLLSQLCIATTGAVVIFTEEVIQNANRTKEFPAVKLFFESEKHVKSGYDLCFLAVVMFKYKIRCNSINDIGAHIIKPKENPEQQVSHTRYQILIDNATQALHIDLLKRDPDMELLYYKNTPNVLLSNISGLTRGIYEVKREQEESVQLAKYTEPKFDPREGVLQVTCPTYKERLRYRTSVTLHADTEVASGDVIQAPQYPRAKINLSKQSRDVQDFLEYSVEDTSISRRFENNFGWGLIREYSYRLGNKVQIPPSLFQGIFFLGKTDSIRTEEKFEQNSGNYTLLNGEKVNLVGAQIESVRNAFSKVSIIEGAAGTGKTTVLGAIVREYTARNIEVLCVANTNCACRRVAEALQGWVMDEKVTLKVGYEYLAFFKDTLYSGERMKEIIAEGRDTEVSIMTVGKAIQLLQEPDALAQDNRRRQRKGKALIVEEASQVWGLYGAILFSLTHDFDYLVVIGDSKQLKPYVSRKYGAALSILDWGLKIVPIPRTFLDVQFRMMWDMGTMISKAFYSGRIKQNKHHDGTRSMTFIDVRDGIQLFHNTSRYRRTETIEATKLYRQLKKEGIESVQVLTFYDAQYRDFKNFDPNVRVSNVDSFQGQEADAVILCLSVKGSKVTPFMRERGRVNVALSRAKKRLIVIGHRRTIIEEPLWRPIICTMKTVRV